MSKSESEILEVLNGLGSKKLDLDILFSYYSLKLSFEIRKVIAEKIGMQERKGYFLLEKMIKKFGLKSVLFIGGPNQNTAFAQASSNIPKCDFLPSAGANVYDILRRDYLVLSREAVQHLEERLG